MNKNKVVADYIENNWTNDEIIRAWNKYAEAYSCDDYIYPNDEATFSMQFNSTMDAVRAISFGEYDYNDDYIRFNGYANIESFNYWDDKNSPVDLDYLVDHIIDCGDCGAAEIDSDSLCEEFVWLLAETTKTDREKIKQLVEEYLEEEDFDFLTEDWDDLEKIIIEKIN